MADPASQDDPSHSNEASMTEAILATIADREGVEAHELRKPLFRVIDPEALEHLFRDGTGRVTFEYLGYVVTVDHTRQVEVRAVSAR